MRADDAHVFGYIIRIEEIYVYELAGPLEVIWKNRRVVCDALVLPGADDIFLGAIPLEAMDLIVSPNKQEVVGAHGDQIIHKIY